jgi:hypothetical protein
MADPSILSSHTNAVARPPMDAHVRSSHASSSSKDSALSSEYIRCACRTEAKAAEGGAPMRCVGDSGDTSSGYAASSVSSSWRRPSYASSEISG